MNIESTRGKYHVFLFWIQFAIILAPFVFFFDAAVLLRGKINLSVPCVVILLFLLNGGLLFTIIMACSQVRSYRLSRKNTSLEDTQHLTKKFLSYIPITVVSFAFTILASLQFSFIPRYDAGTYYSALINATENFTYTIDSLLSNFALCLHPMQGTNLFLGTGEMLFPKQVVGVYGVTLVLSLAAIFCLYGIMGLIFPGKASWLKAAGTSVFAFCPYVLGLFSHINPDYFTTLFFVILVYAFARELDYLAAFFSILLVFSKETGILFAGSFLISAILVRAAKIEGSNYFAKLKIYLFPRRLLLYSLAPLLFAYYALFLKRLTFSESFTNKSPFRWDNGGEHCFGLNFNYISARLGQGLFWNFLWIITLLFVITVFVYFFRKTKGTAGDFIEESTDLSILTGIILSSFVYLLFSCLFITVMCPRYNVCFTILTSLVSVGTISYIWRRQLIVKIMMGGLILLFLLQNYFNLDPSLMVGHEKINLGYQYIYSPTKYNTEPYVGEMYVYNLTYTYSENLLDQMMEKINPDKNDLFLAIDDSWSELNLIGDARLSDKPIYWDPVHRKRTYDYIGEDVFLPKVFSCSSSDILSDKALDLADDFYLVLPAREDGSAYCTALEARGYSIADSFVVKNYLGYLTVYHILRA